MNHKSTRSLISYFITGVALGVIVFAVLLSITRRVESRYRRLSHSVVRILSPSMGPMGSGFIVRTPSGKLSVITNWHVCRGTENQVANLLFDNGLMIIAPVAKSSMEYDLCVVKVPEGVVGEGLDLPINEAMPERFEELLLLGYPADEKMQPSKGHFLGTEVVSVNVKSAPDGQCPEGTIPVQDFFSTGCLKKFVLATTSITGFPGNSGSAIFNSMNQVVGVLNSGSSFTNHVNFIPAAYLVDFIKGE